jgi:hypothetical protein
VAGTSDLDQVLERADADMSWGEDRAHVCRARPASWRTGIASGGWFTADEQRRRVRAVAGNALTWS